MAAITGGLKDRLNVSDEINFRLLTYVRRGGRQWLPLLEAGHQCDKDNCGCQREIPVLHSSAPKSRLRFDCPENKLRKLGMTKYNFHPRPETMAAAIIEENFRIGTASGSERRFLDGFAGEITLATARGTDPVAIGGAVCVNSRCNFARNTFSALVLHVQR